jgi:macrolide-specific efflux system membrane fusion protein
MKKKRVLLIIILVVTAGAVITLLAGRQAKDETGHDLAGRTERVSRRDISSSVIATGIIRPRVGAEVRVGSRISGIVKHLYTNIGDEVNKGQLLAELDPTENKARFRQAGATLEKCQTDKQFAKKDLERLRSLFKDKVAPREQLDTAEQAYAVASARLKEAEANLNYASIQLDYTKIFAPISGVVASVSTQEGETVAASFAAPTFCTIIDLGRLEVQAYVDETDIGRISVGQQASFTVDTYPDTDFKGKVTAIYPNAEVRDNVVNYITLIEISAREGKTLRPEMTTTVTIFLDKRENVLTVPYKAVHRERGRKFVYVLEQQQPQKRWIKTGWRDKYYTEVIEGLKENEQVITGAVTFPGQ